MARPRNPDKPRWIRDGVDGYVTFEEGRAVSVYGSSKKRLGFSDHQRNRKTCLDLHEARVRALKLRRLGVTTDAPVIGEPRTVKHLVQRFTELRLSDSVEMRRHFRAAIRHYLLGCSLSVTDVEAMAVWLTARGSATRRPRFKGTNSQLAPLSPTTLSDYLSHIKQLFGLAVDLGWIPRNPVDLMIVPRRPADATHAAVPWAVAEAAIAIVRKEQPHVARVLEFALLTGMRIHEILGMRRAQIRGDHILVVGKGAARRVNETEEAHRERKPKRIIPLMQIDGGEENPFRQWQERLQRVVSEILAAHTGELDDLLFWHISRKSGTRRPMLRGIPHRAFREALSEMGIKETYVVHGLRKTAEHYFENVLCLEPHDFCDMTGHSLNTYLQRYRQQRNPNQLIAAMERRAQMLEHANKLTKLQQPVATHHRFTGPPKR